MAVITPREITALLWQAGLRGSAALQNLTAIALDCSGGEVAKVVTPTGYTTAEDGSRVPKSFYGQQRGLWLIRDDRGYDQRRMVTDAAYAAVCVLDTTKMGTVLTAWGSYTSGNYKRFLNVAAQAEAQAAAVSGSILAEDGTYVPRGYFESDSQMAGPVSAPAGDPKAYGPSAATGSYVPTSYAKVTDYAVAGGVGQPITASFERQEPLKGLRITGTELQGDVASITIGDPEYNAGMDEIPNLSFTIADPQGDLLWQKKNLWQLGNRVQYLDLDLRIDEIKFAPGGHGTGQLEIACIDAMVYALQHLRGARVVKNVSPTAFIREEIRLAGFNPDVFYMGENLPVATQIARDVPTENQAGGDQDPPSAWTTIQRLAKEAGRRAYISGRRLIFGSVKFSRDWAAPGELRIGWHSSAAGERWLTLPTAQGNSTGSTAGGTEVVGKIPLNRARYFRPGVGVIVYATPSVAAGDRKMVCSKIAHSLSRDIDGAEITLMDPVDPKAEKR